MDMAQNILLCGYCNEVYRTPVFLPCFNTICAEDLKSLCSDEHENSFTCPFCAERHTQPPNGFTTDHRALNLIKLNFHKLDLNSLTNRKVVNKTLETFELKLSELKTMLEDPKFYVKEKFDKLRAECDLRREELKSQIDEDYLEKLQLIDLYEKEAMDEFKLSQFEKSKFEFLQIKLKVWSKLMDSLVIDERKWKSINDDASLFTDELRKMSKELESEIFLNRELKFVSGEKKIIDSDFFGRFQITQMPKEIIYENYLRKSEDSEDFYEEFLLYLNEKSLKQKENIEIKREEFSNEERGTIKITELKTSELNSRVPSSRSGHMAVCDTENLWLWGGYNCVEHSQNQKIFLDHLKHPELWRFNFKENKWKLTQTSGDVPVEKIASHSLVLSDYYLLLFGGTNYPFGTGLCNSLYICNLVTLKWKKFPLNNEEIITPTYGSSLVIDKHYLYVLFGTDGSRYPCQVRRIDLRNLSYVKLFDGWDEAELDEDYPEGFLNGRFRQGVVLHEERLFVFGGSGSGNVEFDLSKIPVFDLRVNEWRFEETKPDNNRFPSKRKFHSTVKLGSKVFIMGGRSMNMFTHEEQPIENTIWYLDLSNMTWTEIKNQTLPLKVFFNAFCANESNEIYLHGGSICQNSEIKRVNNLFKIKIH